MVEQTLFYLDVTLSFIDFILVRFLQRLFCNAFSFQFHLGLGHRTHIDNSNVVIVEVFILYKYSFYYNIIIIICNLLFLIL